jgi:hypothetical protein
LPLLGWSQIVGFILAVEREQPDLIVFWQEHIDDAQATALAFASRVGPATAAFGTRQCQA